MISAENPPPGGSMRRVLPLALGAVTQGLDAYVIAGILPAIAVDQHLTIATVGQLVTAYTLAYAVLSPICATLTAGRPIRSVLLGALVVFTIGNVLSALAVSLPLLLISRVIAGAGAGVYSPTAAAAAAGLVAPERKGRALSLVTAGLTVGTAFGVPLGLALASVTGWRGTLWLITGMGVVTMIAIAVSLPAIAATTPPPLRARAGILADRRVLAVVGVTALCSASNIGMYTYVAPVLQEGLDLRSVTGYLWLWGLGGLVGSLGSGVLIDRMRRTRTLVGLLLVIQAIPLLVLGVASGSAVLTVIILLVWGAAGWGTVAPQQHRLLALRRSDGPVAVSLNASMLYLGSALGAGLGGLLLSTGEPITALPLVFGALALVAVIANFGLTSTPPENVEESAPSPSREQPNRT